MRKVGGMVAVAVAALLWALPALAEKHDYQVTGPVVEIKSDSITVMKGKEKWEISKDASTKMPADVKVGDKVTVHYWMTATEVESKAAAKPAKAAKPAAKKKAA